MKSFQEIVGHIAAKYYYVELCFPNCCSVDYPKVHMNPAEFNYSVQVTSKSMGQ